jgi:hypothetical protein
MPVLFAVDLMKMYAAIFILGLIASFISEVTYKKRSLREIRQDWKNIVIQGLIIFAVFTVSSIVWMLLGKSGD